MNWFSFSRKARLFEVRKPAKLLREPGSALWAMSLAIALVTPVLGNLLFAQVETFQAPQQFVWVARGRIEGHLARNGSPAGAFSLDGKMLAIASGDKILLTNLEQMAPGDVLRPSVKGVKDLAVESASFVGASRLFVMAKGTVRRKGGDEPTPLLGFLWNIQQNALAGKVDQIGAGSGFGPIVFFPQIAYVGIPRGNVFTLWNPMSGRTVSVQIPELTSQANLYTFSPDGHWLLLAQIEGDGSMDPVVVRLQEHKFTDVLAGHLAPVNSINFSRDSSKVVTASDDGKIRIYSAPHWKLLATLTGHRGPVRWAEFSPDGRWVVSAGEDGTVRVWSVDEGKLDQTLAEPRSPMRTAAFSPDGNFIAASTENAIYVWQKSPAD